MATLTHHYEGMFILDSGKYGANPEAAAAEVSGIIEKAGGTVVAHRPWQDSKLAYQINGNRKGLYYLAFFTAPGSAIGTITGIVKLNDNVIRHMVLSHDQGLFEQMVEHVSGEAFRHEVPESKPARAPAPATETGETAAPATETGETAAPATETGKSAESKEVAEVSTVAE